MLHFAAKSTAHIRVCSSSFVHVHKSLRRVLRSVANDINFRERENSRFVPLLSCSRYFRGKAKKDYAPLTAKLILSGYIITFFVIYLFISYFLSIFRFFRDYYSFFKFYFK